MELDLKMLGITQEELQDRVIDGIVERIMNDRTFNEYGDPAGTEPSSLRARIEKNVMARIDAGIAAVAEKHVLPNVESYLENFCLQETNQWGEKKKGAPVTFIEYLVAKANEYMGEQVDYWGKTKKDGDYNWRGKQTRVTHLINQHLQNNIETAMQQALGDINKSIAQGLYETCRLKINELAGTFKIVAQKGQ
jgi:hypothetical protein